jgi:tellurite methyltransferase
VAMGTGRNAVYLAKKGFDVEGVDISPEAVRSALDQARAVGVTLKARVADLESDYHIEKSAYDVIICLNIMSFLHYFVISGVFTTAREL